MVIVIILLAGLALLLLPQIVALTEAVKGKKDSSKEAGDLSKAVDAVLGPGLVVDSSTLETPGEIAVNNLKSNLTLTPVPNDPLFGVDGFFTNIGNVLFNPDSSKTKEVVG